MNKKVYVALSVVALVVAGLLWVWWFEQGRAPGGEASREQVLYEKNCAVCHGTTGDGKGKAAYLLQPKPRKFRAGKFRLVTSQNLSPTREDVVRVITNGMPGTPMPSWGQLSEADREALADYVLKLYKEGWYDRGIESGYSTREANEFAVDMSEPDQLISVSSEPAVTKEGLAEGKAYYREVCGKCHGENGEGKQDPTWRTDEGYPSWSRDLRSGVFKGGRDGEQLYLRFFTGLPGTPMPAGELSPEQVWRVVQYVQSLSDPAGQEQAEIRIRNIVAQQLATVPSNPDDAAWESASEFRIPLMPLWWHEGYIDSLRLKAVYDGERLAFLLEWNDSTHDTEGIRQQTFPDGAALQLTANLSPPLFAMGEDGETVNIWHWKALWDEDRKEFQDVAGTYPQMVSDGYYGSKKGWRSGPREDSAFLSAVEAQNPIASLHRTTSVEDANAAGFGTFTSQDLENQNVEGVSTWKDGVWRLQITRNLNSSESEDVPLSGGKLVSVAFAVWNGSAGDRNGQKSVSIWNTLAFEGQSGSDGR